MAQAEADAALVRCTRSEAATLTAELLSCYPDMIAARRTPEEDRQFQAYTVKLFEAFEQFSYAIGKALVHAGTGLPATLQYRPKPSDVMAAGLKARQRFEDIATMASRHVVEAERRRLNEDAEPEVSPEARARMVEGFKALSAQLKAFPDPMKSRSLRTLGEPEQPKATKDPAYLASLLASHDAGLAEQAQRRAGKVR